jgi:hypothetical protein
VGRCLLPSSCFRITQSARRSLVDRFMSHSLFAYPEVPCRRPRPPTFDFDSDQEIEIWRRVSNLQRVVSAVAIGQSIKWPTAVLESVERQMVKKPRGKSYNRCSSV